MSLEKVTNTKGVINKIGNFARGFYEDKPHFYLACAITGIYLTYLIKEAIQ